MNCKSNDHKFRKLNEQKIFCARCGETRTVSGGFSWTWRPWPQPIPYWSWTTNTTSEPVTVTYNQVLLDGTTSTISGQTWAQVAKMAIEEPETQS